MLTSAFGDSQNSTKLATPSYTSPYAHSNPGPSSVHSEPLKESAKPSGIKPGIECEIVGCSTPIFYLPSGSRPLCTKHRIEKQSASAKAAAPKPAAPVSRSFNKDKLYPPKKDDKQYLKRKRPAAKRSNSGNHQDMGQESPTTFTFQPPEKQFTFKAPEPLRHPPTPTRPSPRSAFRRTPERKGKQASMAKSPTEVEQAVDDLNRSLGSASMAESPIEPVSAWQGNLFSR
jgi:hypothetical protein